MDKQIEKDIQMLRSNAKLPKDFDGICEVLISADEPILLSDLIHHVHVYSGYIPNSTMHNHIRHLECIGAVHTFVVKGEGTWVSWYNVEEEDSY